MAWVLYAGLVLMASQVLPVHSPVAIAAVTVAAAVLLTPTRIWIRRTATRLCARR